MELLCCPQVARLRALEDFNVSLCTSRFSFEGALQTQLGASQKTCIITAEGRGWNQEEKCKASYTYATFYCAPFRYSYGCFGFRFDSFFFVSSFLCCYTQRKQTQLSTSMGPQQSQTDHASTGACCAALQRAVHRQELSRWRGDRGFSLKKHRRFLCRLQCSGKTTQGRGHPCRSRGCKMRRYFIGCVK